MSKSIKIIKMVKWYNICIFIVCSTRTKYSTFFYS